MRPTFVLVHGGQQGPWAFDLLAPELRRRGCGALAVDLPISDPAAGAAEYAQIVALAAADAADAADIVLVGHSMGGLVIPLVAAAEPAVRRMVFVCAAYPEPGRSHLQVRSDEPGEAVSSGPSQSWRQPGDLHMLPPDQARELFYHDCPEEVREWAVSRMRPQANRPLTEITPLNRWPSTPRTLIIATDDRCIPRDSAMRTAMRLFGERPMEIPGDHCLPLSRPRELADVLLADALVE